MIRRTIRSADVRWSQDRIDGCNARARNEEFSMRKQECFDYSRRALLSASGALALLAALRPLRTFVQASDGKLRIGIIGSGHIGGAIGGLWVKAGHPVLFSSRHLEELSWWRGSVH